ncbi:SHOCT domain-containing protein [Jannaschia sp. S6380]|uniref:SHOCT domain-containing protein n=1 Tax=Jannaschia sp. S6380 TaxID=2926408 RepID=UPI001FF1DC89|nr:SHOCT domain-containing protein [Jannaschia sp. S6380]MCK0166666.1 SHOCT domain-containing protein [Jannaschia sp. S6380]
MYRLGVLAALFATPALADPDGYGHMSGWGYGMGMMFGPILWIVVLGLVVAGVVWFVRNTDVGSSTRGKSDAMSELDLRFAKGEIDAEDYTARKKLLTGE